MIVIIRISGMVEIPSDVTETLSRIHLRKKFAATLLKETPETMKLIQKIRNFVAYGKITPATLELLLSKRGKSMDKKNLDSKKIAEQLEAGAEVQNLKPFFRLHPPRGGIKSKIHYPKGILGDNGEEINDLVRRML